MDKTLFYPTLFHSLPPHPLHPVIFFFFLYSYTVETINIQITSAERFHIQSIIFSNFFLLFMTKFYLLSSALCTCVYRWLICMCVCLISNLSPSGGHALILNCPPILLTRYESPLSSDPSSPLSLHLSFPRGDKVILLQSEIRWVSSSADRWRWGQAPNKQAMETHSRSDGYQEEGWHIVSPHSGGIWEGTRACNVFLYLCMCFTDCKEMSVLLSYDRCVRCAIFSHETI